MIWTIVVLAVLILVLFGFWVSWRASRLDRLHNRVEAARTGLDLALVRRWSAAADLASSGQVDPATSMLLADAVLRATLGDPEFRAELEAGDPQDPEGPEDSAELLNAVEKAAQQVSIARMFYNDLAGRTLYARSRPLARVLHLSGSAGPPEFFDMDDALTDGEP